VNSPFVFIFIYVGVYRITFINTVTISPATTDTDASDYLISTKCHNHFCYYVNDVTEVMMIIVVMIIRSTPMI